MKLPVSIALTLLLLTGCATGRNVQILEVCPRVPILELELEADALERPFLPLMLNFLSGNLPEPTGLGLRLPLVSPTQERLNGR